MVQPGTPPVIGVIGGSGVYEIDGLKSASWRKVSSSFGEPSDELLFGELNDQKIVFLPRHGRGHRIPPSELNNLANIDALKRSGVTEIISISACGSLKEELAPGHFVIVDQFIDRTFARKKSFFSTGLVAHVGFGHPVCSRLGDALEESLERLKISYQRACHALRRFAGYRPSLLSKFESRSSCPRFLSATHPFKSFVFRN